MSAPTVGNRRRQPAAAGPGSASGGARAQQATKAGPARGARWLLLIILSLGSLHVVFMLGVEGLRLARAEMTIDRLEREVRALESEAAELRSIIEHRDDERYREQLARRQGYMYPDEVRIVTSEPP